MEFNGINFTQYYFPKEANSMKLITLFKWENIDDFNKILTNLDEIQRKYDETLKKFVK